MLQTRANNFRSRLCLTASALVIAAAATAAGAYAGDVNVVSAGSYNMYGETGNNLVIGSGVTGSFVSTGDTWDPAPTDALLNWDWPILWAGTPASQWNSLCLYDGGNCWTSASITVASGGTLKIYNSWGWMELQDMITANGTVEIVQSPLGGPVAFLGTNYFNGDVILDANTGVHWGEGWIFSSNHFGTATNFVMGSNTAMVFNEPHTIANVINTISSADANASIIFNNGSMTVNGQNTLASSYFGSVAINAGSTFIVGDATHASAIFGDVAGSTATIAVNQSGGSVGSLKGYGTIYGNVTNNGKVQPGGTAGTIGTLAIVGNYTQGSLGQLVAEVGPAGVSKLTVSGTATLSGSLVLNVDEGNYTTPAIYNVLTAGSVSGSFSTISVAGTSAFVGAVSSATGYQVVVESQNAGQTFAHQATANRYAVTELSRALFDRAENGTGAGKWIAWGSPFVSIENIGRDGLGYNNTIYGLRGGVEYHSAWRNAVLGGAVSYGTGSMDVKGEASKADSNTYSVAAYGGTDFVYARIDGSLFFSAFDTSIDRSLDTAGTVHSSPKGTTYGASVQISKNLFGDRITPYASGFFARVHLDGVTETGNDTFALKFDPISRNYMSADLGFKVHLIKPTAAQAIKLDINVAIEHDFSDRGETATASFANITGSTATYHWLGDSENTLVTGLYFADSLTSKIDVFARLGAEFSPYKRAGDISIGAKYHF